MVVPHNATVYVQVGDVPGIHYTAGSDGIIYYEVPSPPRTNGVQSSDLKYTYFKLVQDDNWDVGQRIHVSGEFKTTAAMHISLDCITGASKLLFVDM